MTGRRHFAPLTSDLRRHGTRAGPGARGRTPAPATSGKQVQHGTFKRKAERRLGHQIVLSVCRTIILLHFIFMADLLI